MPPPIIVKDGKHRLELSNSSRDPIASLWIDERHIWNFKKTDLPSIHDELKSDEKDIVDVIARHVTPKIAQNLANKMTMAVEAAIQVISNALLPQKDQKYGSLRGLPDRD